MTRASVINQLTDQLLPGARIVTRKPTEPWDWNGIDTIAAKGPGRKYILQPPLETAEELHRLGNIRRSKPANEEAWRKHVPRPKNWDELVDAR